MEAIFLRILNMSITAGYVILALLLIRFFLKRAPKKYSYLLWSAVLFRLICPVSFSSVFSIFQMKLFDMTAAGNGSGAALNYVPADIGYMQTPKVTSGIPAMNTILSGSLPAPAPYASVNPLQLWILLGSILWSAGIAVFLILNLISYIRLTRRMATAVRLKNNIYESDKIRSPFILGFLSPRIYIPFGLNEQECRYILCHENYHLKRKDHLVKLLSFFLLAIHWFNPLVWLAYVLMSRDMEMSCDEKVLSDIGTDISCEYSTSLLSFATNRRLLSASPLAFGETGVRERIKNVLHFKKPSKRAIALAITLCIASIAACAANPMQTTEIDENGGLNGNYIFEKQIYMNPLSSFIAFDGYLEYYTFTRDSLLITDETGSQQRITGTYNQSEVKEQDFKNSFIMTSIGIPDISSYKERRQYTLTDGSNTAYRIYLLDDEIWLARIYRNTASKPNTGKSNTGSPDSGSSDSGSPKSEYIWSIYKMKEFSGEVPVKAIIYGTQDGVENFLALQGEFKSGYENDICYNITPEYIKAGSEYQIFKYNASCAPFLLYKDKVYPLGEWFGGLGVTSMAIADIDRDKTPELYFTYSWGSGLHRSNAAYFNPSKKEVIPFAYTHLNGDLLITGNKEGGLSLYAADITNLKSFADFTTEGTEFISDIVFENNDILLSPAPAQ